MVVRVERADAVWRAEHDADRTERRFVACDEYRHDRDSGLRRHAHGSRFRAHVLFPVAARPLDKDEQLLLLTRQRVDALTERRYVMRTAVDEDHAEFFHDPADKRHAPQLLLGHDADHFLFRQGKQNPDGVCHAGVVGAENAAARRDLLPARHMKDRVPEKQPDAAQPPAQMIPEVHPSFLLTISKMALTDCSTVSPEVSSSTASAACFNGAMARSESCLSRCFVSARICA